MISRLIYRAFNWLRRHADQYQFEENLRRLNISPTVNVYNSELNGNVEIGEFSYIAPWSVVSSGKNSKVVIGRHCAIGRYVSITSRGHSLELPTSDETHLEHDHVEADTIIGDYVWIGDHVFVKHGIRIGDNAIVGAGSVVTRDVEPFEIVGGIPARHLRFNTEHHRYSPPSGDQQTNAEDCQEE